MSTQTLKNKIAAARKRFKAAKEISKSGGISNNIEDGRYKAQVTSAKGPVEAQGSGRLQAIIGFKILEGEYKDEKITKFPNLEHEVGLGILIRELQLMNYEVEDFDGIEAALDELNKDKPTVRITVKTKDEFQNVSIDKLLGEDETVEEEEPTTEEEPEPEEEPTAEEEPEAEAEVAGEEEIAEGDTVSFTVKGEEITGEVLDVVDEENLRVKAEDKKVYKLKKEKVSKVAPEEPEKEPEAEEGEETVELEEGSRVSFTLKGKETEGEIVEVVDEENVRVKSDTDKKIYRLSSDKIQPVEKKKEKVTRKLPGKKK